MKSPMIALSFVIAALGWQQPAFRSGIDAVRIDVQVLRDGRPVPNLTAADFELRDDGVPQHIEVISLEQQPVDVLFAFDTSESMKGDPLSKLKDAARAAIGVLAPDDRAALLTFSHKLVLRSGWTRDRGAIAGAIESSVADGATALQDTAFAACALRERARGRMLVLVFSDGMDTISWLPALRVLDQARRSDLVFDAVSLPPAHPVPPGVAVGPVPPQLPDAVLKRWFLDDPVLFRQQFLHVLADETGGDVIVAPTSNLRDTFVRIVSLFKSRYVLSYVPRAVPETGWHPVDVHLKRGRADIHARPGYQR